MASQYLKFTIIRIVTFVENLYHVSHFIVLNPTTEKNQVEKKLQLVNEHNSINLQKILL